MAGLWLSADETVDPTGPFTNSAIRTASWILFKLTAEKYPGISTSTETYRLENNLELRLMPEIINGKMYNIPRNGIVTSNRSITLRHTPVHSIVSVTANGSVVSMDEYEIVNGTQLQRRDKLPWLISGMNELTVTYEHGSPPPSAGKRAAIRLANELIWAETGSDMCSLPDRVTSVSRQGISYTILDPQAYIVEGRTGIYEIDLFINAANPLKAKKKPKIYTGYKPFGERRVR